MVSIYSYDNVQGKIPSLWNNTYRQQPLFQSKGDPNTLQPSSNIFELFTIYTGSTRQGLRPKTGNRAGQGPFTLEQLVSSTALFPKAKVIPMLYSLSSKLEVFTIYPRSTQQSLGSRKKIVSVEFCDNMQARFFVFFVSLIAPLYKSDHLRPSQLFCSILEVLTVDTGSIDKTWDQDGGQEGVKISVRRIKGFGLR